MRRLVVSRILPSHTHAVGMVVHECRQAVIRRYIGGENIDGAGVIAIPKYNLLTPVAKKIGL
jgi:hypothetical protein